MSDTELLAFNGINGDTGGYLVPPMSPEQFIEATFGKSRLTEQQIAAAHDQLFDADQLEDIAWRKTLDASNYGVKQGIKADRLEEAGWGVIFPYDCDAAIITALEPLLTHRNAQAGKLYKNYSGAKGYRWRDDYRESKGEFLKRQLAESSGPVNPEKMPYYLLIVGDPHIIPYSFQYQMDVQYAVGRIHFDTPEEYARYAQSVVAAETGKIKLPRRAAFFAPSNPDDLSTNRSAAKLVPPLATYAKGLPGAWDINHLTPQESTRAQLTRLMGGDQTPAFLFSASHGMGYGRESSRQRPYSGGLVCADWPGPNYKGDSPVRDCFFAAEDVKDDVSVAGMIAMFFACYGAGTPQYNDFATIDGQAERSVIADKAFVGKLPQRLLSHPNGGALAVMGHVDRVWDTSFLDESARPANACFESALGILLQGMPIGMASEYFNSRYAEIGSELSAEYEEAKWNPAKRPANSVRFTNLWTSNNDARNYVIVGDPAVRLWFGDSPHPNASREVSTTPTITPIVTTDTPAAPQSFGMVDDTIEAVTDSLRKTLAAIVASLQQALESLANLEVATYTSSNLADVTYPNGNITGAKLRAVTKVSLGGNTLVVVPENDGKVDDAVWKIHSEAIEKALANRNELMKVAISAVSGLVGLDGR